MSLQLRYVIPANSAMAAERARLRRLRFAVAGDTGAQLIIKSLARCASLFDLCLMRVVVVWSSAPHASILKIRAMPYPTPQNH
jgi:hypothetical protein